MLAKRWAVAHPWAGVRLAPGFVLVYGPRDDADELETVTGIVATSYAYATGRLAGQSRYVRTESHEPEPS